MVKKTAKNERKTATSPKNSGNPAKNAFRPSEPKVAVVITNWNGKKDTIECIESLEKSSHRNFKIIVVDNGSADNSEADIKAKFPSVDVVHIDQNIGLAAANNVGVNAALDLGGVDYVVLANNDVIFDAACLKEMVNLTEKHPEVAVATPLTYFYYDKNRIWSAGIRARFALDPRSIGLGEIDNGQFKPAYVDAAHCVIMIRATAFDIVGLFKSEYIVQVEEVEWCLRARQYGFRTMLVPSAKLWHKVGATVGAEDYKPSLVYFITRNWLLAARDLFSLPRYLANVFMFCIVLPLPKLLIFTKNGKPGLFIHYVRGLIDALLNRVDTHLARKTFEAFKQEIKR